MLQRSRRPTTILRRSTQQQNPEYPWRWRRMRKSGLRNLAVTRLLVAAFAGIATLVAAAIYTGLRINTSYSLPLGIYVRTADPNARLIEFCPVEPFATESSERGYRP